MKVIEQSFRVLTDLSDEKAILRNIELAGRVCYKSEYKITEGSCEAFVKGIIKKGHESVIEHALITVSIITDRGVTHELVRHRLSSFSQESTRYVNYEKKGMQVILPVNFSEEAKEILLSQTDFSAEALAELEQKLSKQEFLWISTNSHINDVYDFSVTNPGDVMSKAQDARGILPNSLKTEIVISANPRQWRNILKLRTGAGAHPQIKALASDILGEFKEKLPTLFGDL